MKKNYLAVLAAIFIFGCAQQPEISDYENGIEAAKDEQYEEAISYFISAASSEQDKNIVASALYNAGFCYGIEENFESEIEYYKKALEASDSFQPALYDLGVYYKENNDIENSLKMFNRLIDVNPFHEGSFYMMGLIYKQSGDLQKSEEYLKKAAELGSPEAQAEINKK